MYIIIGKSKYIFKDFSSDFLNSTDAKKLFKDNKGIKNYEKEKESNKKDEINKDIKWEEEKNNIKTINTDIEMQIILNINKPEHIFLEKERE